MLIALIAEASMALPGFARPAANAQQRSHGEAANFAGVTQLVRASIVQIECRTNPHERPVTEATGFVVGQDGSLITMRHVVHACATKLKVSDSDLKVGKRLLYVGIPQPNIESHNLLIHGSFTGYDAGVVDEDIAHDLALIRTAQNLLTAEPPSIMIGSQMLRHEVGLAKLSDARPEEGSTVATSGYPFSSLVLVTTFGYIASSWEINELSGPDISAPDAHDFYLGNFTVNGGNSGGPVYSTKDGTVIGICQAYLNAPVFLNQAPTNLTYNSGLTVIIPARYITELLKKNNVKPSP